MPLYSYNGGLLGSDGGLAGGPDCCCDGDPPPECEGACDYYWDAYTTSWMGLSPHCSAGCECPEPPSQEPGPGDPTFINQPCVPVAPAP